METQCIQISVDQKLLITDGNMAAKRTDEKLKINSY